MRVRGRANATRLVSQVIHRRPHSSLNYQTPAAFAASYREKKKAKKECREYTACGTGVSPPEDTKTHSPLSSGGGARISRKLS